MQKYSVRYRTVPLFILMICYSICLFFTSCTTKTEKKELDTSQVTIDYKGIRFDQEFVNLDVGNLYPALDSLGRKYPDFTGLFLKQIAALGNMGTQEFDLAIRQFLTQKDYKALWDTVALHFPNTANLDAELKKTLTNIKYFYPEEGLGTLYYFVSGLNRYSAITIDSAVGVGLDMYLGATFPHYKTLRMPINDYELHKRDPYRIPIDVAQAIFEAKFPYQFEGKNLLDMMLYKGKELYFVEQVCRTKKDYEIVGFKPEQKAWCVENEKEIYYYFANRKLLYSTTWQDIMPYINDGPNTSGMGPESPGNIGSWLGWQIVRRYMNENPKTSLQELMTNKLPAQQFLRAAKYKP